MKVSSVTASLLGLGLASYTYAQQPIQPDFQAGQEAQGIQPALPDPENVPQQAPQVPQDVDALLASSPLSSSSSSSDPNSDPNSDTRTINIKVLLDPANGGDLAAGPRSLGFDLSLKPVTPVTRKYNALLSTDAANADADVLRSGASDFRGKGFYLTSGVVRGREAGVLCKVVSPEGQLTELLPFEAPAGQPVPAIGVACSETVALLEEAREEEERGDLIA